MSAIIQAGRHARLFLTWVHTLATMGVIGALKAHGNLPTLNRHRLPSRTPREPAT